jgi:hypothetical protein
MVKLVDTLVSGTSARKGVEVQILFRAEDKDIRRFYSIFNGTPLLNRSYFVLRSWR